MDAAVRDLLAALQRRAGPDVVAPLISPVTASAPDPYYGLKPLFWALSYGQPAEVLRRLLEAHPEAALERHPKEGWTPLHYAERLDADGVRLLLKHCPEAAAVRDACGDLPLHWAAEHCAPLEVIRLLLEANPEAAFEEDSRGCLPFRLAADNEAGPELLELLRGANRGGAAASMPSAAAEEEQLPVALLFPGDGSQHLGMLKRAVDVPAVKAMLEEAQALLGLDLLQLCLEGPEELLWQPRHYQPALLIGGLAGFELLKGQNPDVARRHSCAAGLGVGELAALTAAGVFSFSDALRVAAELGQAMQDAANVLPQATLLVVGLEEKKLRSVCEEASAAAGDGAVCTISCALFTKGHLVAGAKAAVDKCMPLCKKAKALQAKLQPGACAAHTPLMAPALARLRAALAEALPRLATPRCKVFMGADAAPVDWGTDPQAIVDRLCQQLTSPLLWRDCVKAIIADGVEELYEVGPGTALKAHLKRIDNVAWGKTLNVEV